MPLVAHVGRKSFPVRMLIASIYLILIVGSIATVYPFWLMLAGSVASNHMEDEFNLIPRYLYSERGLFEAHLYNKYYRYFGVPDLEWQWKMKFPPAFGSGGVWQMVPGMLPNP